jgi:hypothetical protein
VRFFGVQISKILSTFELPAINTTQTTKLLDFLIEAFEISPIANTLSIHANT